MAQGIVKSYDPNSGSGIVLLDTDKTEVYIQPGSLKDSIFITLRQGQRINFEIENVEDNQVIKNEKIGSKLYTNGYSVRTTLDPSIQIKAEEALIEGLEKLDKRQGWRGPISNYNLLDYSNEELSKYLQELQTQLPKKRYAGIVIKVSKKFFGISLLK